MTNSAGEECDLPGFRYYLPRPFVVVKTEFPIYSDVVYAVLKVTDDGTAVELPQEIVERFHLKLVPGTQIQFTDKKATLGKANVSVLHAKDKDSSDQATTDAQKSDPKDSGASQSATTQSSGGHVALTGPFDIVYMPDYDQQYAVEFIGNADNTSLSLQLTNGWMLENIAIKTDGTALSTALSTTIGKAFDMVGSIAGGKSSGGGDAKSSSKDSAGKGDAASNLQSEESAKDLKQVAVKISFLEIAVPGAYPIFKPTESPQPKACGYQFADKEWNDRVCFRTRVDFTVEALIPAQPRAAAAPTQKIKDIEDSLKAKAPKSCPITAVVGQDQKDPNKISSVEITELTKDPCSDDDVKQIKADVAKLLPTFKGVPRIVEPKASKK